MSRSRLRDLGVTIGTYPTGKYNAITDVPDVRVGHHTLNYDEPHIARTGVTIINPRGGKIWHDFAFAGFHSLNGCGEMTGVHWINESGLLTTPIAITNTHDVGIAHHALVRYGQEKELMGIFTLPVAAETYDGWLNDPRAKVTEENVWSAIESASSGVIAEGCVGGGTGMTCHEFKGGIGTSSRIVQTKSGTFTVGALVQSNYGSRELFRVDGVPVGKEIGLDKIPSPRALPSVEGSIIVIIATDAPLLPDQCKRLAQRATMGIARVGGVATNGSGDLFLAFSTANHYPNELEKIQGVNMMPQHHLNELFVGAIEAVEESILNSITMATTTRGQKGRIAYELPLEELKTVMKKYGR
jgi:D-aminopeptidase